MIKADNIKHNSPFKKGALSDIVRPKKRLYSRFRGQEKKELVVEMSMDIVKVLADMGLVLKNTHTIARKLVENGWEKTKKIEKG